MGFSSKTSGFFPYNLNNYVIIFLIAFMIDERMIDFKKLCNCFKQNACVLSIEKKDDGVREIRIVDGNDAYINTFNLDFYSKKVFVPNSIYTDYLPKNLNFEEYCYRCAVKKELLHSYAYPENIRAWLHMLFIPIEYKDDNLAYCLYIMEMNQIFDPELLVKASDDVYSQVLNATLQLSNTADFNVSLKNVIREIRKICNALFCCILLVDDEKRSFEVLSEDYEINSNRRGLRSYVDDSFYNIIKSWDALINDNGNCIIINDKKGMDYIKEMNRPWYESLTRSEIKSLVLFKLKTGNTSLGYMWVTDFKADDTPKIKEILEMTTFVLGSQIGNHLLLDKLTRLSSIDVLTGLYNRNRLNSYMNEIAELEDAPTALVFSDINGLKPVNDNEGHLAGDKLIKMAAKTLTSVFKKDPIFRVGGDEFVVILRNVDEKQINSYLDELHIKADENNVSFSTGYASSDRSKDIDKLLKKADENMYVEKKRYYCK